MNIQEEIHSAIQDIKGRLDQGHELSNSDLEVLLLTSLIEEEA